MSAPTYFSDEFDLRGFAAALARGWWLIALFAGVAALAALGLVLLSREAYTAQADVALLNIRSAVVFDPDFTTVPEEAPPFSSGSDARARALMALAQNKSLLLEVQAQVGHMLGDSSVAARLLGATRVVQMGDLLRFEVTWDDPETAAAIANAWATNYVKLANRAFMATGSRTPAEAEAAARDAFARYQEAETAMQQFLAESPEARLIRLIDEASAGIDALQEQKNKTLALIQTAPYSTTNHLLQTLLDASLDQADYAIEREIEAKQRELDDWYERRDRLNALILRLQDVQSQLQNPAGGAVAAGDALALLLLRAGLAEEADSPDLLLQIDPVQLAKTKSKDASKAIDAMLAQAEQALAEADVQIQALSLALIQMKTPTALDALDQTRLEALTVASVQDMLDRAPSAMDVTSASVLTAIEERQNELERQRRDYQAQLEAVQARRRELARERDAAWDLYTTLDNKAREVAAQFATGAPQARVAIAAVAPGYRDPRNTKSVVLAAAMLGALLGAVFVLTRERLARSRVALDDPSTTHNVQ